MTQLAPATKTAIPKFSKSELLGLEKYDRMVVAIAECQEVDELVDVRNRSQALQKYSAAAKHYESELRAMDVRIRASRRAGELLAEGQKHGEIAVQGGDGSNQHAKKQTSSATTFAKPKTLDQLGISRDQSSAWKELAGIPQKEFEEQLPSKTHKRTSEKEVVRNSRPKPDPVEQEFSTPAEIDHLLSEAAAVNHVAERCVRKFQSNAAGDCKRFIDPQQYELFYSLLADKLERLIKTLKRTPAQKVIDIEVTGEMRKNR
jgi:hypothetical protein